jgi:hypothetical protein
MRLAYRLWTMPFLLYAWMMRHHPIWPNCVVISCVGHTTCKEACKLGRVLTDGMTRYAVQPISHFLTLSRPCQTTSCKLLFVRMAQPVLILNTLAWMVTRSSGKNNTITKTVRPRYQILLPQIRRRRVHGRPYAARARNQSFCADALPRASISTRQVVQTTSFFRELCFFR